MESQGKSSQTEMLPPVQNREELVLRLLQHKETLSRMGVLRSLEIIEEGAFILTHRGQG